MNSRLFLQVLLTVLGLLSAPFGLSQVARAAGYPERAIRMVIAYPPGGGTDLIGRVIAQQLGGVLKTPAVVVNKSGAGGTIGAAYVASSPADGYTIFFAESSLLVAPHIYASLGFDLKSFTPIASVGSLPLAIVSSPSFPAVTWTELIALLKSKPGQYSYATGGIGSIPHLSGELFQQLAGVKLLHVPYQGGGKLLTDVMSGEVPLAFISVSPVLPLIRAGKLNLLALTSPNRAAYAPGTPTVAEQFPGFATALSFFVLAPAGLSSPVRETIGAAVTQALKTKKVEEAFAAQGALLNASPLDNVTGDLVAESAHWGRIVKDAGIKRQ